MELEACVWVEKALLMSKFLRITNTDRTAGLLREMLDRLLLLAERLLIRNLGWQVRWEGFTEDWHSQTLSKKIG